ncbi:DUF2269 domain-containing protein [Herbaspirillum seropedicae]|uniref:DUF2269 family protein n=1 Tax=Herbaspirillum seropedicae TaxID=964 RepID=UPI0008482DD0|nr:DUF2269 domain-containing protein [Herbaspirillum seropedicae]AON57038.1 integral membrane protein [Herbaspirillum seropedicae]QDD66857.1 DUF2269 domain-containing protein [Herbaspirillum seropedicae]
MDYLAIKWLHIMSATFMFGTGFGTAFYMFVTNRSRNVQAIAVVTRWVVRADWWFTTPAVIIQPISGLWMMHLAGYPVTAPWLAWSLALYALAGSCWLPVVWLQLRMRDMAQTAAAGASDLPERFWRFERIWIVLGFPAFGGLVIVYWLMVHKPM